MSTKSGTKLNKLLRNWSNSTVMTMTELLRLGYSRDLVGRYIKSHWLTPIGQGAYIKPGSQVSWLGGVYALQDQLKLKIHVGGLTALKLQGIAQYAVFGRDVLQLFGKPKSKLPKWFSNYDWGVTLEYHTPNLFEELEGDQGLTNFEENNISIQVSTRERAIFEALFLVPNQLSFTHAQEIFESLATLRPNEIMALLLSCRSIKVKRLFMYLSNKSNHKWFDALDALNVNLGKGKRVIEKNGKYDSKYMITVPTAYEDYYNEK